MLGNEEVKKVIKKVIFIFLQELEELNGRLEPLKSKLDSYHNLPPDIALAKTKVAEANLELVRNQLYLGW